MDIREGQISIYIAFLQMHRGQVTEFQTGIRFAFGTTDKLHFLRQEIIEVRQVGIQRQGYIHQHIA